MAYPKKFHTKAFALWCLGFSFEDIARQLKIKSPNRIIAWAKDENWEDRKKKIAVKVNEKIAEKVSEKIADVAARHINMSKKFQDIVKTWIDLGMIPPQDLKHLSAVQKEQADLEYIRLGQATEIGKQEIDLGNIDEAELARRLGELAESKKT